MTWLYTYDNDSKIGALGDSAHSGLTVVGKPEAASLLADPQIADRDSVLYIQTNRGFLHGINFASGDEFWGFVPPNILETRLPAMKYNESGLWYGGNGVTSMRSVPMVLLDGMLTAGDVRFSDGSDHTVLLAAMGWGGNGIYAMDVTKQDAANRTPQFLWAVENARYADSETNPIDGVKRWGLAAGMTNARDYDYHDLGLTIQAAIPIVSSANEHVTILPGGIGYKVGLGGDTQGKVFYFLDAENGAILKKIDTSSLPADFDANGRPLGMAITPITYITPNNGKTTGFYTVDSEGSVLSCDTSGSVRDWGLKGIFQLRTYATPKGSSGNATWDAVPADLPLVAPRALLSVRSRDTGSAWLFGGTADLMLPDSDLGGTRKLVNEQQFIFGINRGTPGNPGAPDSARLADLKQWEYISDGILPDYGVSFETAAERNRMKATDKMGWALRLRPKMDDPVNPRDAEYATTAPYLAGNELYIATFVPRTRSASENKTCPEVGDGKLYILNPLTGTSRLTNKTHVLLPNIKITGISVRNGRIYLGIQQQLNPNSWNEADDIDMTEKALLANGTIGVFKLRNAGEPITATNIEPNVPHLHYWRERVH